MDNTIKVIEANKTAQEFYGVTNNSCPICGSKFEVLGNIVKLGNVAFDLECYMKSTDSGIKIK